MVSPAQMSYALQHFMDQCSSTLNDLHSAYSTECLDASTSNRSFAGFLISSYSNSQNHHVANRVDALQQEGYRINEMLIGLRLFPLSLNFSGDAIRQAENAEHSFLPNFLISYYSSFASGNTMGQISSTISKIEWVRREAAQLQYMLHPNEMQQSMYCRPS